MPPKSDVMPRFSSTSPLAHSVINPTTKLTAALHIYGGDFFNDGRSEWDPESLTERPFDFETSLRQFQEMNERHRNKAA